jgi:hypothetical protein
MYELNATTHLARMAKRGLVQRQLGPVSGPWVRGWVPACE